jgi:hypothetical protein
MRPAFWHDRRVGDNVVRVRHFHNAPPFNDGGLVELPCDCGEPDKRERPPP